MWFCYPQVARSYNVYNIEILQFLPRDSSHFIIVSNNFIGPLVSNLKAVDFLLETEFNVPTCVCFYVDIFPRVSIFTQIAVASASGSDWAAHKIRTSFDAHNTTNIPLPCQVQRALWCGWMHHVFIEIYCTYLSSGKCMTASTRIKRNKLKRLRDDDDATAIAAVDVSRCVRVRNGKI